MNITDHSDLNDIISIPVLYWCLKFFSISFVYIIDKAVALSNNRLLSKHMVDPFFYINFVPLIQFTEVHHECAHVMGIENLISDHWKDFFTPLLVNDTRTILARIGSNMLNKHITE